MENDFKKINLRTYSTKKALEVYSQNYLRPYEKIIYEEYVEPGMKILDLGCGVGRSTVRFKEYGADVIGIDMVPLFIEAAYKKFPDIDFRVMDASELSFSDNSFDMVCFLNQGLDYTHPMENRMKVLKEVVRVLRPGGIFIYTFHNSLVLPRTKRTWLDLLINLKQLKFGYHVRTERHENGELKVSFDNIWSQKSILKGLGLELVRFLPNKYPVVKQNFICLSFFERWPMFICKKL